MDKTYCRNAKYESAKIIDINFKKIDKILFEVKLQLELSDCTNLTVNIPRCEFATMALITSHKGVNFTIDGNCLVNSNDETTFTFNKSIN